MTEDTKTSELHNNIVRYYETCDTDYAFLWHLKSRMAMHYGYWDDHTRDLKTALWNMNDFLARKAGIKAGDYVLDAGCGIGGSCFYLAEKFGCKTHGITLSSRHVAEADALSKDRKVAEQVSFSVNDFCHTDLSGELFNCVWALESVCHAADKADFIAEAFRLLRPGGRLVVGDFFQNPDLTISQKQLMQQWAASWAVPFFETAENFSEMLRTQGFENIVFENITSNIKRSAQRLNRYFIPGLLSNAIMPLFGKRKSAVQRRNVWSVHYQNNTLKKGLWKYGVFTAVKPL